MQSKQINDKTAFSVSLDGWEYVGLRSQAATRAAELRKRASELESSIEICDLIYTQAISGSNSLDCKAHLTTAGNHLASLLGAAV